MFITIGIGIGASSMMGGGSDLPDFANTPWQLINFASWNTINTPWNI